MPEFPQVSLPAACAECLTTLQSTQPGARPQQYASKVFRSAEGKMRIDSGHTSVITDPGAQQTILLDHLTKEARIFPATPPAPPQLGQLNPSALPLPPLPSPPAFNVKDLGKRFIEGHEVDGKQYTFQPPTAPQLPGLPPPPQLPQSPHTTAEVWTSTKLQIPVLTKYTGSFGEQICHCKNVASAEPAASMFQIPPDYKPVLPSPPTPPSPPAVPGLPR